MTYRRDRDTDRHGGPEKDARIARRRSFRIAAAALTAAAALSLTACNSQDTDNTNSAGPSAGDMAATGSSVSSDSGSSDAKAKGGTEPGAAQQQSGEGGGRAQAGVGQCCTENLEAAFATGEDALPVPEEGVGGSTTASIVLTNTADHPCRIGGFPGVDLTSINGGERWSLVHSSQKWSSFELEGGQSTDFKLNIALTDEGECSYQPAWVEITPPGNTKSLKIEWSWEDLALVGQRGATRPAAFVNPIG